MSQQGCSFVANERTNKCSHFPWISEKLLRQRSIKFQTTCTKMLTVCAHNSQNSFTKVLPSNKGNNKLSQKINELLSQKKTERMCQCVLQTARRQLNERVQPMVPTDILRKKGSNVKRNRICDNQMEHML